MRSALAAAALILFSSRAPAQIRLLLSDRAADSIWTLVDADNSGDIDEATEVFPYYTAARASGTPVSDNINAFAVRPGDRAVVAGDQVLGLVFFWRDVTGNGDANDGSESFIAANTPARWFAFPTGVAFDSAGDAYVCNAGNANGDDVITRLRDLDDNLDYLGPGEVTVYVGEPFFGPGNGAYSPQELAFAHGAGPGGRDVLYLRNSSGNLHGVYRFIDLDDNGRADDPGEAAAWFTSANMSGVTLSAGFTIEPDPTRPGSLYMLQTATGSLDQLYRLTDVNADGDANDAGEAVLVWSTSELNFLNIDAVALPDGTVLITDNGGKKIVRLRDANGNGIFSDDPRTTLFQAVSRVGDVRQLLLMPPPACVGDHNRSEGTPDDADVARFFLDWNNGHPRADVNGSGGVPDDADIARFFARWADGC